LGKRGNEELEKFVEEYFKSVGKPFESSDAHASSSSAPPRPDHGSTNVVQAPAPNPASSSSNPDPSKEPPGPSSTAPIQTSWEDLFSKKGDDGVDNLLHALASTEPGSDHELTGAPVSQPNPNKRPLTDPDPDFDWDYWMSVDDPKPPGRAPPKPPKYEKQVEDVQQPNPGPSNPGYSNPQPANEDLKTWKPPILESSEVYASSSPPPPGFEHGWTNVVQTPAPNPASAITNPDPHFDWDYWMSVEDPKPPGPASPKRPKYEKQVEVVQQPNPRPSKPGYSNPRLADEYLKTWKPPILESSEVHGKDDESTGAHAPQPNPNKRPLTHPDLDLDWNYWSNVKHSKPPGPAPLKRPKYEIQLLDMYAQRLRPGSLTDSDFEYMGSDDSALLSPGLSTESDFGSPQPKSASPNEVDQAHRVQPNPRPSTEPEPEVVNPRLPNLVGSSKGSDADSEPEDSESDDDEVVQEPPSSPNPELHQPSSAGSEPVDLLAAIYAAKGKAKVAGTARDVGIATQSELQPEPAERSLDPGE
jgi:hypothetical protein